MTILHFVADLYAEDMIPPGGGELNNDEFIKICESEFGIKVYKHRSYEIREKGIEFLEQNKEHKFIIANFLALTPEILEFISNNLKYAIYEHDHKYLSTRDPTPFPEFKAPSEELRNVRFYNNALAVFCQSKKHAEIAKKNLPSSNIINLSGNLWSLETLNLLKTLSLSKKDKKSIVMNSVNPIKNTNINRLFCEKNKIDYKLIGPLPYKDFLESMSVHKSLVFFPGVFETLCRVAVECRMMNIGVVTNTNLGAVSEPWFKLKGEELIDHMFLKRKEIPNKILGEIL